MIYLPEALAHSWWRDTYLLCLVLLVVHLHASYSRPGLVQYSATVSDRIILVQVCFNCFYYENEAEEIPDSAYQPSFSRHQSRDEKDTDGSRNVGLTTRRGC